ncbi:hypothetical protein BGZ54_009761 [Gamsiella multidivaricata]|nr:hypothetical protein BGZ54_009761 [Gamsiella multidivaricata]
MFIDSLIGWASLVVGIAGVTKPHEVPNANIHNGLDAADGHIPTIKLKDTSGRYLGGYTQNYDNLKKLGFYMCWNYDIKSQIPSELRTLELKMESTKYRGSALNDQQHSLDDALCLAHMSWSPDDSMLDYEARRGAISGDLLYFYGYSWRHSEKTHNNYDLRCG